MLRDSAAAFPQAVDTVSAGSDPEPPSAPPGAGRARRRRLWQLPEPARELAVALGLDVDTLRAEAQRAVGRMHRARCRIVGEPGDVLDAVLRDLGERNALSEAVQLALDRRHARAIAVVHALRDPQALRARWSDALSRGDVAATLWALLTHPEGPGLDVRLVADARAWGARCARQVEAMAAERERIAMRAAALQTEVDSLRARILQKQREHEASRRRLEAGLADLAGRLARAQAGAPSAAAGVASDAPAPAAPDEPGPDDRTTLLVPPSQPSPGAPARTPPRRASCADPAGAPVGTKRAAVHGRRVLCVGGVQHAVARYRREVERRGGQFEHHDGGLEEALPRLDSRLARADLVICQAGCINHEAYHRIKRHCARTGTPCIYLERPGVARFAAALADGSTPIAEGP
ncbi:MAG: DUF2325 domain-containing protein [Rubrivivax sp.]|nr:DUF2325 domain-containing protein [Rubrivivax sp.]